MDQHCCPNLKQFLWAQQEAHALTVISSSVVPAIHAEAGGFIKNVSFFLIHEKNAFSYNFNSTE